ncbi:hypothetical protein BD779DRAFT_1513183 [Infundibulicybe gibba]|nr:hypothetical protein BD779DRAFT_1513183 [Infundibulicybe gibba]
MTIPLIISHAQPLLFPGSPIICPRLFFSFYPTSISTFPFLLFFYFLLFYSFSRVSQIIRPNYFHIPIAAGYCTLREPSEQPTILTVYRLLWFQSLHAQAFGCGHCSRHQFLPSPFVSRFLRDFPIQLASDASFSIGSRLLLFQLYYPDHPSLARSKWAILGCCVNPYQPPGSPIPHTIPHITRTPSLGIFHTTCYASGPSALVSSSFVNPTLFLVLWRRLVTAHATSHPKGTLHLGRHILFCLINSILLISSSRN